MCYLSFSKLRTSFIVYIIITELIQRDLKRLLFCLIFILQLAVICFYFERL